MGSSEQMAEALDIEASGATPTNTGVEGAIDVDVYVADLSGEVTMVRDTINGGWRPYGDDPNLWVESNFLESLRRRHQGALRAVLDAVEDAAAQACADYQDRQ